MPWGQTALQPVTRVPGRPQGYLRTSHSRHAHLSQPNGAIPSMAENSENWETNPLDFNCPFYLKQFDLLPAWVPEG